MKSDKGTTVTGFTNPNQQVNLGLDNSQGTDLYQKVYALRCDRVLPDERKCGNIYGVNGSGIFQAKCPKCQHGKGNLPLTKSYN